ncbi:aconitase X [[Clostridium] hylemonae]|uniref:aconitase X n=1 Tax=[Clostridium] hylemonae TaxID=89153 RepID=UPI001106D38C|nr:aconitase X catalytic domain-containing protein [[Clostridium] hylemonae]
MQLTEYEQEMLDGRYGEGMQAAIDILVKMGGLYGAERFLPVKNAHIDAAAYTTIWDAGTEFVEFLADKGAKVSVPTTINPMSMDTRRWREQYTSEAFAEKCERLRKAYMKLGVNPTWTCAPYQCTNVPVFGENVSWSESNAVNYVNSVVGARTERLPDLVDVCCAVAGRVPEYGLYLEENRAGEILFTLKGFDGSAFRDTVDYAVLGYLVGETAVNRVPVVLGLPESTMPDQLKAFSAAAASGGATSLFHAVGLTPEAPTLEAAFHGKTTYETVEITPAEVAQMRARLNTGDTEKVDMVLMGCPHLSFQEIKEIACGIEGKKVHEGTEFWIQTSHPIYELASLAGYVEVIEKAGAMLVRDTCLMEMEYNGVWRGKHFVTNSGKAAQYAPAINGVKITMADMAGCVEAAVTGKRPKEA